MTRLASALRGNLRGGPGPLEALAYLIRWSRQFVKGA